MLRQIASLFANHLLQHTLGLVGSILAARLLGVELRGVVVVVAVAATLGMTVCQLGLPQALNYNLSRSAGRGAALGQALAVCWRLTPFIVLCAVAFFALTYLFGQTTLLQGLSWDLILAAFLFTLAMTAQEIVMRLLLGLHDYRMRNVVNVFQPALTVAMLTGFWISGARLSPWQLAWAYVAFTAAATLAGAMYLKWKYQPSAALPVPQGWKQDYVGYGLKFYPSLLVNTLNYRADTFLVNAFLGSAAVGLYATGMAMTEMLLFLPHTVNFVFFNHISRARAEERHRLTVLTLGASLYLVVAGGVVLGLMLPFVIPFLYGADFAPAVPAALWLLPGMAALTVVKVLTHAVAGCGKPEYATYTTLVGLAAILALDVWLIPSHGIVGAAWASSAGYSLWAVAVASLYCRLVNVTAVRLVSGVLTAPLAWLRHKRRRQLAALRRTPIQQPSRPGNAAPQAVELETP